MNEMINNMRHGYWVSGDGKSLVEAGHYIYDKKHGTWKMYRYNVLFHKKFFHYGKYLGMLNNIFHTSGELRRKTYSNYKSIHEEEI